MTGAELLAYDAGGQRTELIRGQLMVRESVGGTHAGLLFELSMVIGVYLRTPNAAVGRVLVGDPGVWLEQDPDTVRAPDLAFVSRDRLMGGAVPDGFLTVMPDLAVEIRSPTDRTGALLQKVGQWLDAGVAAVWVIDPVRRNAQCYERDGTIALVGEQDAIDGGAVLPGLRISLASLWSDAPTGVKG
jgi:Uma2 family endonuclease